MNISPKMLLVAAIAFGLSSKGKAPSTPGGVLRIPKDGARFTLEELRAFAAELGFPDPALAAAVAMAESGGFASALGDNGKSVGLWQINTPSHPSYDAQSLLEPSYNGQAALSISKQGSDWNPWTTFRTGAYQRYMPPAVAAGPAPAAQLAAAADVVDVAPSAVSEPAMPFEPEAEVEPGEHLAVPVDEGETLPIEQALDQVEHVEPVDGEPVNGVGRVRIAADEPRKARARRARRG